MLDIMVIMHFICDGHRVCVNEENNQKTPIDNWLALQRTNGMSIIDMVVYCDVMMASRRHDTMDHDEPLCHNTIGSS